MDKLKEAVAKAIEAADLEAPVRVGPGVDHYWDQLAQAAIDTVFAELMEPSDEVINAGAPIHFHKLEGTEKSAAIYKAMLSAARGGDQ